MLSGLGRKIGHACYLKLFALVEGTYLDQYVRQSVVILFGADDLEKRVEEFYLRVLTDVGKLFLVVIALGEIVSNSIFCILLFACLALGCISPFWDLHVKRRKRKQVLEVEYCHMVMQLLLYIGAGMSISTAFERTAQVLKHREDKPLLQQEMQTSVNHLKLGQVESQCYYQFGKRCELSSYLRLGGLLAQNVKTGNAQLIRLLEVEMEEAQERLKHLCKRKGERASTKLLGPMMLLLAMVLIMIMIPAFENLI